MMPVFEFYCRGGRMGVCYSKLLFGVGGEKKERAGEAVLQQSSLGRTASEYSSDTEEFWMTYL